MKEMKRRRFLERSVLGLAGAATPSLWSRDAGPSEPANPERKRLERLLEQYGSELGRLRHVRSTDEGR